jgi:hypothetical protein
VFISRTDPIRRLDGSVVETGPEAAISLLVKDSVLFSPKNPMQWTHGRRGIHLIDHKEVGNETLVYHFHR